MGALLVLPLLLRLPVLALIAVVAACLVVNLRILLIWLLGRGGREALLVDVASSVLQDAVVIAIFGPKIRILMYLLCISSVSCVYPARLGRSVQDTCIVMYPDCILIVS